MSELTIAEISGEVMKLGALGGAVASVAVKAAQKLRADYQEALSEFDARAKAAQTQRQEREAEEDASMDRADRLANLVAAQGVGTSEDFVRASLQESVRLATRSGQQEFVQRAQALLRALQERQDAAELTDDAVKLANELHVTLSEMAATDERAPDLTDLFEVARAELDRVEAKGQREALIQQIERLEALPSSERKVALQGLANIRDRVARLAREQAKRGKERERRRDIVGQAVAMMQAVMKVEEAPERPEALKILDALAAALAGNQAPSIDALEGFLAKSRALFEACQSRLDNEAKAAVITDSVAETLLELGYAVSMVPDERRQSCLARMDESTGMLVHVDDAGMLRTEMVAFDPSAAQPDKEAHERVCSLVDDILDGLKRRDIKIREKSRKNFKPGEVLRVIDKPEVTHQRIIEKPKEQALP